MFDNDNQTGSSGNSIYSKFRERLRRIKFNRIRNQQINKGIIVEDRADNKKITNRNPFIAKVVKDIRGSAKTRNYKRTRVIGDIKDEAANREPFRVKVDLGKEREAPRKTNDKIIEFRPVAKISTKSADKTEDRTVALVSNIRAKKPSVKRKMVDIEESKVIKFEPLSKSNITSDIAKKNGNTSSLDTVKSVFKRDRLNKNENTATRSSVDRKKCIDNKKSSISEGVKRKKVGYVSREDKRNFTSTSHDGRKVLIDTMGAEIIDKIKSSFEDKLDELEVLASELYLLNQEHKCEVELKKVQALKKRINELIARINELIEQYNLYKKNYYIDNVIGLDDNILVEDIIDYRTLLDSFEDEKAFVKEYKALDEFVDLYNNLISVKDETERLQEENERKIEEYQVRDKKHDNVKLGLLSAIDIDRKCDLEIEKQNEYFDKLMSKVNKIDRHEYVTTHLRGVGNLISQSLQFMGLILSMPFAGMIPGISMQTIATRKLIANAFNKLHFEDVNHVYYDAINYDSELNHHLNDVYWAENLLDNALDDVERLKKDFISIYNSSIPGFEATLKNINKIEKKLIRNQNRVFLIKKKLKMSKKLNENKLKRVRELNYEEQKKAA